MPVPSIASSRRFCRSPAATSLHRGSPARRCFPSPFSSSIARARAGQSPRRLRNSWKRGTADSGNPGRVIGKLHQNHALLLVGLPEADREGRTGIADEGRAAHRLRDVEVPQGEVVDPLGEDIRPDLGEGADVELPHAVAVDGAAACREQVPHGDDRNGLLTAPPFPPGRLGNQSVMPPDPVDQLALLLLDAFTRLGGADIAVPEVRDGADDKPGLPVRPAQHDRFLVGGIGGAPHDMDVQALQKLPGRAQEGRGIVIPRGHHDMAPRPRPPRGRGTGSRSPGRCCWGCRCRRHPPPPGGRRSSRPRCIRPASPERLRTPRTACGDQGRGRCASQMCAEPSSRPLIDAIVCPIAMIFAETVSQQMKILSKEVNDSNDNTYEDWIVTSCPD